MTNTPQEDNPKKKWFREWLAEYGKPIVAELDKQKKLREEKKENNGYSDRS